MSLREMVYEAIEKSGEIASSLDLLGVAGITDRADLHNILYGLQKRGKITFRERHNGGQLRLARIRITKRKEQMQTEAAPAVEEIDAPIMPTLAAIDDQTEVINEQPAKATYKDIFLDWLDKQPKDSRGWVMITSGEIAGHLGFEVKVVQNALKRFEDKGTIEVLRDQIGGGRPRVIGVRTADAASIERHEKVQAFKKALYESMPDTPLLDEYEQTKDMAANNKWLTFEPEPIYEEGLRLKSQLIQCINRSKENQ